VNPNRDRAAAAAAPATQLTTLGEQLFDQVQDTHTFEKKHPAATALAATAR